MDNIISFNQILNGPNGSEVYLYYAYLEALMDITQEINAVVRATANTNLLKHDKALTKGIIAADGMQLLQAVKYLCVLHGQNLTNFGERLAKYVPDPETTADRIGMLEVVEDHAKRYMQTDTIIRRCLKAVGKMIEDTMTEEEHAELEKERAKKTAPEQYLVTICEDQPDKGEVFTDESGTNGGVISAGSIDSAILLLKRAKTEVKRLQAVYKQSGTAGRTEF